MSKFRHYLNLRKTEPRLRQLVKDFRFTSIRGAVGSVGMACANKESILGVGATGGNHCLVVGEHNG